MREEKAGEGKEPRARVSARAQTVVPYARKQSAEQIRAEICSRLQARRSEIEQTALTRVYAIADPSEIDDPEYLQGLRAAVAAALDYGFDAIEGGESSQGPIPAVLLEQAGQAARNGIGLDTVLRRYLAGYTLFSDFLLQEAEEGGRPQRLVLREVQRSQAVLFDPLIAAVAEAYEREAEARSRPREQRRIAQVKKLLAGDLINPAELAYELDGWHLALVIDGAGGVQWLREAAGSLDRRLLAVGPGETTVWAWLGGRQRLDSAELAALASQGLTTEVALAVGEPGRRLAGWRLSHRQASAALPIALRRPGRAVRYAEVGILASTLRDETLVTSLRELYLAPLEDERDGGAVARQTLRAYFAAQRNVSSTASALGVTRRTVANRLRSIEGRLGRPLATAASDLEAALRLQELEEGST